ncbi:FAD-dependent monooxygenase [Fodinicola feengrottensis]|uniref:FAD-dependent monooxygenase n=2 Tax=Fodinicola feengrottensis TaxID=435914 RepID=A0ABN2GFP4_9ACTN
MLAAELKLAGANPVVLERLARPSGEPRARGIGPLATEALQRRGLGELIARHDEAGRADKARDHGSEKAHFASIFKIDALERKSTLIWQVELEKILLEHAVGMGVPVWYEHAVTGLEQDEDGVTVRAGDREIRAAYVVGCDGGRGSVRKLAGFDFPGTAPLMTVRRVPAHIEDVSELPPPGRVEGGTLFYGHGMVATFDFADPDRWDGPITVDEMQASVKRVSGVDVTITDVQDGLRFTDQARQVTAYRLGRVLLAGDAAHVHSPSGGQGLNLGLMDAVNLGWKLAATVAGTAPEGLLDSYHRERHPVGADVLHNTRAQSALLRPGPHTDALRDIVADLMDIPEVNRHFGLMMSGLDVQHELPYECDHPLAGRPCPDLALTLVNGADARLSELTRDGDAVLLAPAGAVPGAVEVQSTGRDDLVALLVRPDGVVAWAAGPGDAYDTLDVALRAWSVDSSRVRA